MSLLHLYQNKNQFLYQDFQMCVQQACWSACVLRFALLVFRGVGARGAVGPPLHDIIADVIHWPGYWWPLPDGSHSLQMMMSGWIEGKTMPCCACVHAHSSSWLFASFIDQVLRIWPFRFHTRDQMASPHCVHSENYPHERMRISFAVKLQIVTLGVVQQQH